MYKLSALSIAFILFISISLTGAAKDKNLAEFNEKLKGNNLEFVMPDGFVPYEVDITKCEDVNYFYAIKHKSKKLEVRYSIYPYQKAVKEPNHVELGSDGTYQFFTYTVLANIAGEDSNILKSMEFPKEAVTKEFNADWGTTSIVKPGTGFGKGYKFVMITSLYKSGSGYGYVTFLFDEFKEIQKEYMAAFYSMKFKADK